MIFHPTKNNNSAFIGGNDRQTADGDHIDGGLNNIVVARSHIHTWSRFVGGKRSSRSLDQDRHSVAHGRGRVNERHDRSFTRFASIMPVEKVCALGYFLA